MEICEADFKELTESLEGLEDHRRQWGNLRHKLMDIIVLGLSAILCRSSEYADMEAFGRERYEWFKEFLELPHGIPDESTFERVFSRIQPEKLRGCLQQWLNQISADGERQIHIDGKTIRGSAQEGEHDALHVVSAWVNEHHLVLGQVNTDAKSNEITVIPRLLDMLEIQGDIITIDAMGCQTDIARKIVQKHGQYVLAVKENQPTLYEEIREHFRWIEQEKPAKEDYEYWKSGAEKDHGRIERREVYVSTHIDWLKQPERWAGIRSIIHYRCTRIEKEKTVCHDHYYISSLESEAQHFGQIIRNHWSIENNLHWVLDVVFGEDASRVRKNHAPENLNILRKVAIARIKTIDPDKKRSFRTKMFKACLNHDYFMQLLFGK